MAKYLLYDMKIIENDSTMENFAKSLLKNLNKDYEINKGNYGEEEYKDEIMNAVYDRIRNDLSRTDIDYIDLMEKYSKDIGQLLYDMENNGYDLASITLSFFNKAAEGFEIMLYKYIEIHFDELEKVLCQ